MTDDNQLKTGVVTNNTDDTETVPVAQLSYMKKFANIPLFQPYGLTSRPLKSAFAYIFNIQGQEQNRIAFFSDFVRRFKKLKPGEVVIENMKSKVWQYFKDNGDLQINVPSSVLENVGSNVVINVGNNVTVTVGKDISISCDTLSLNIEGNSEINCNGQTVIKGDNINLGDLGGPPVARIGDSTSDGATIVSGSSKVKCA